MKNLNEIKINLTSVLIAGVIILFLGIGGWKLYINKVNSLNDKISTEVKLRNALIDIVKYYRNSNNELVAEKLAIQLSVKDLSNMYSQLNENQKEMVLRIKEINKKNDIITAALVQTQVKIDSLMHKGSTVVDVEAKKITFSDFYKVGKREVNYSFIVGNVLPSPLTAKPTLLIDSLYFPNSQFIEFHWNKDKKKGYPISFSISNSNEFFKTVDIQSYAIPSISKEVLNPNFWQKIGNFGVRSGDKLIWFGAGGIVGAITLILLTK